MRTSSQPLLSKMRWHWKNLVTRRLDRDKLHIFWKNPTKSNQPQFYAGAVGRSEFLYSIIKNYSNIDSSVLEIGCNAGRNLNYLYQKGYRKITGLEINKGALDVMKETFPDLERDGKFINKSMEEGLPSMQINSYDLVFTMAVLEHLHKDSEYVFKDIARIAKQYLVTIEDESGISKRHFPRNYQAIFEPLGLKQIYEEVYEEEHVLTARLFSKS